jgi:putative membrane protein
MKCSARNLTRIASGLAIAGLLPAVRAFAGTSLSHEATSFIKEASEGNQGEIALARLAQEKSQNPEIKQLAQMMQSDHQQAQDKLQTIAQAHGVTLDQGLTRSQKRSEAKLEKLSGADFDQQYAKDTLEGHVANLNKFQKASENLQETDVKQYALDTIPKMQEHLQKAESAAKAVGVDPGTISSITSKAPAAGGTGEQNQQESGKGTGKY